MCECVCLKVYTQHSVYTYKTLLVTNGKERVFLKTIRERNGKTVLGFAFAICTIACGADLPLSWLLHLLVSLCTTVRMMNFIDVLIVVWQRPNADVDGDVGSLIHGYCLPHSHGTYRMRYIHYIRSDTVRYGTMRCDAITI